MSEAVNPEMLALAREARGLTQTELAKALGTTQAYISKYESGFLKYPAGDLAQISRILDFPKSFFLQPDVVYGFGSSCFYHRKRQSISLADLRRLHAQLNVFRLQIARLLKAGVEIEPRVAFEPMNLEDYEQAPEFVARALRASWNLPLGPITNLVAVIERAGGIIFKCPFGTSKVDAISLWVPDAPPMFFLNEQAPGDRLRWTLAHELGHLIMHRVPTPDMEREADRFAAEFLMPEPEIRPHLVKLSLAKLAQLKPYWKVSMQALVKRAAGLGKITPRQYRTFFMMFGKLGYRMQEPVSIPSEDPVLVKGILDLHQKQHGYSIAELSEMVNSTPDRFMETFLPREVKVRVVDFKPQEHSSS